MVAIARFTVLEAWRTRVAALVIGLVIVSLALAEFAASLAVTDSASYRLVVYGAAMRCALVALTALVVAISVAREFDARRLEQTLAYPLARSEWYGGRLLGFSVLSLGLASAACVPLVWLSAPYALAGWGATLALELVLIAAASLTASVALVQPAAVAFAVAAFYVLARSIEAMLLLASSPLLAHTTWASPYVGGFLRALALLLPALEDGAAASRLYAETASSPAPFAFQIMVYVLLLAAVGAFDLARRDV